MALVHRVECTGGPWDTISPWDRGFSELKSTPFGFKVRISMYLYQLSLLKFSEVSEDSVEP
jgi:hypothetical protein